MVNFYLISTCIAIITVIILAVTNHRSEMNEYGYVIYNIGAIIIITLITITPVLNSILILMVLYSGLVGVLEYILDQEFTITKKGDKDDNSMGR